MNRIAHIDGLRAVAVLAVLAFHLGFSVTPGGFVGVDVFFVISGYVITRMIRRDLDADRFSFRQFYAGRVRRLYPALIVSVTMTLIGAALLMTPAHVSEFAGSAIAALTAWSNLYFWSLAGYFATGALTKPLLHTWTLSVEWQFYAIWPALLVVTARLRTLAPLILGAIGVASLAANLVWQHDPSTMFYWMPFRIFEFVIGALALSAPSIRGRNRSDLVTAAGLGLIAYAVLAYNDQTLFPSYNALPPAIGGALVIWAGADSRLGLLLANKVSAYIGRISYSTYLVHWPIIVFYTYYAYHPLTLTEGLAIGAASIALGAATYHGVELPFWKGAGGIRRLVVPAAALASIPLMVVAYSATVDGWEWRIPPEAAQAASLSKDELRRLWGRSNCREPCEYGNLQAETTVLVMGDSHVDHYAKALSQRIGDRIHFLHLHGGSCYFGADLRRAPSGPEADGCDIANAKKLEWMGQADFVIHAQRWMGYGDSLVDAAGKPLVFVSSAELFRAELADVEKLYANFTGKVILVDSVPSARMSCLSLPQIIHAICAVPDMATNQKFAEEARALVGRRPDKFVFINPADYLCTWDNCEIMDEYRRLLYVDDSGHLSDFGARRVVPFIARAIDQALSSAANRASKPAAANAQSSWYPKPKASPAGVTTPPSPVGTSILSPLGSSVPSNVTSSNPTIGSVTSSHLS